MPAMRFDLLAAARQEMLREGFNPDFPPETDEQLATVRVLPAVAPGAGIRDLRNLLWSSIDNDTSRDLDQIEVAERVSEGVRVLGGIADVDSVVTKGSPIDQHAAAEPGGGAGIQGADVALRRQPRAQNWPARSPRRPRRLAACWVFECRRRYPAPN